MKNGVKSPDKRGGWLFFLAGVVGAMFIGWVIFPMALYSKQAQPLNFNHKLHTDPDIGIEGDTELERCMQCHYFRDDGTFSGIPRLENCMQCHDDPGSLLGDSPDEAIFNEKYLATNQEVPWLIYYKQPDCVYFSHIAHVKMGQIECATCHGNFGESESLPVYEKNRLTGYSRNIWGRRISGFYWNKQYSDRMKMDDCARCHTEMGHEQNNECFVCHK